MSESICDNCKNLMIIVEEGHEHKECLFIPCDIRFISKCSHFDEKSQDFLESDKEGYPLGKDKDRVYPRNQPGKKQGELMCGDCKLKEKAVYINKKYNRHGLCQKCYDNHNPDEFKTEDYVLIKQPKKKEEKIPCGTGGCVFNEDKRCKQHRFNSCPYTKP